MYLREPWATLFFYGLLLLIWGGVVHLYMSMFGWLWRGLVWMSRPRGS